MSERRTCPWCGAEFDSPYSRPDGSPGILFKCWSSTGGQSGVCKGRVAKKRIEKLEAATEILRAELLRVQGVVGEEDADLIDVAIEAAEAAAEEAGKSTEV